MTGEHNTRFGFLTWEIPPRILAVFLTVGAVSDLIAVIDWAITLRPG